MRRSILALTILIAVSAILLMSTEATFAAPKPALHAATKTTGSRSALSQMRNTAAAANISQAKRLIRAKKGGSIHFLQVRNPNWAVTGYMMPGQALVVQQGLRYQGLSAHIHTTIPDGSYVHYGMVNWLTKGATTDYRTAHAVAAQLRLVGLQARVVTKTYKF
jgi:hypothetical protein